MDLTVLGHVLSFSLLFSPLPLSLTGTQSKKKGKEEEEEAGEKNIWGLIKHGSVRLDIPFSGNVHA